MKIGETGQKFIEICSDSSHSISKKIMTINKYALIRASKVHSEPYFQSTVRKTKRKPLDTSPAVDNYLEEVRELKFKGLPSRQKSVFCYAAPIKKVEQSAKKIARYYGGNRHIILPPNNSKIFQSPLVIDFYISTYQKDIEQFVDAERYRPVNIQMVRDDALIAATDYWKKGSSGFGSIRPGENEVFFESTTTYWGMSIFFLQSEAKDAGMRFNEYLDGLLGEM